MKPVNEEPESKILMSENVNENVSEDLTICSDVKEPGAVNELLVNKSTLYFDINTFVLFKDVPENEETLEIYLSNIMDANKEKDGLKENYSDEIKELEEKYISSHNLYASLKVYNSKPKPPLFSKENVNHSCIGGVSQMNHTDQHRIENKCNHNVSDNDRKLSSDKSISIELNNNASDSIAENKISLSSCSSALSNTKKSIASSLKELSLNLKPKSSLSAYSYMLKNLGDFSSGNFDQEQSCSSENNNSSIIIESCSLLKTKKPGTSDQKGKLKKCFKFEPISDVRNSGPSDSVLKNISLKQDKGFVTPLYLDTKVRASAIENFKSGIKKIENKSEKKPNVKLKYSEHEDEKMGRQLRVELTDFLANGKEYQKLLKNKKRLVLEDSLTSSSCTESYSNDSKLKANEREEKSLPAETKNLKNRIESSDIKSSKRSKRKLNFTESDINHSLDKSVRNQKLCVQKANPNKLNSVQDNKKNDKAATIHSQTLNVDQRNIKLKASQNTATKSIAENIKFLKKKSSLKNSDLGSSHIIQEKESCNQDISNKSASPHPLLNEINHSQTEELENTSKNYKQKNSEPIFPCNNKTNILTLKDPELNNLKGSDTFSKPSSTSVNLSQKQSPFMQLFSKFTENEAKPSEVKMFSAQEDFINFLSGSCKILSRSPQNKKSTNDKSSPKLESLLERTFNDQSPSSDDGIGPSDLQTPNAEEAQIPFAKSSEILTSIEPTGISVESLSNNKVSMSKEDQKICKGYVKDGGKSVQIKKNTDSFLSVPSLSTVSNGEFVSRFISSETSKKESTELKHLNLCDVDDYIDTSCANISKNERVKRSSKNSAESKTTETSPPQFSSFQLSNTSTFTPKKTVARSTNSAKNIDSNSSLKRENNSSLSITPSYNSVNTSGKVDKDLNMTDVNKDETELVSSDVSKAHDDICKALVGSETVGKNSKSLFNNRSTSNKKHKCLNPEDNSSFFTKKEKMDSFSSATVNQLKNTLEGDNASLADIDALETESMHSNLSESYDDIYPSPTKIPNAGRKQKSLAKSEVSDAPVLPSPYSSEANRLTKKKLSTNSEESISSSPPKKRGKINTLDSSSCMTNLDDVEMESIQPNLTKDHDSNTSFIEMAKDGKKKKLVEGIVKSKLLEHSSLISNSYHSPSTSDNKPLSKRGSKVFENSKKCAVENKSTFESNNLSDSSNRTIESDSDEEWDNKLPNKVTNAKILGVKRASRRNNCNSVTSKQKARSRKSIPHSEVPRSASKGSAVSKVSSTSKRNYPSVKRRLCLSTHSADEFDDSFQNNAIQSLIQSEQIPMCDARATISDHNSSKESAKRNKSSLKSNVCRMIDTSEVQRECSVQNSDVKHTPRKSARLKEKNERRLSQLLMSSNSRRKTLKSESSYSAGNLAKMQSSPEKDIADKSGFSDNPALTSTVSSISNQNPSANNNVVPYCDLNQLVPVNTPVYFHPATNCLLISLSQLPPIFNQSIVPNINQFNSQYQVSQMPFQTQNLSNLMSSLSLPATPQNVTYPMYQTNSLPQPSNFHYNNPFNSNVNALTGLQTVSNNMPLNTDSSSGNQIFAPKSLNTSTMKLNAPNIVDVNSPSLSSASAMRTVNSTTVILKDTQWTTTQNSPPCAVDNLQNPKVPSHPVNRHQNNNIKSNSTNTYQNQSANDDSYQTDNVKLHTNNSHDKQNIELPDGGLQNSIIKDIVNGMIMWDNVMHNLTGFTCLQRMSDFTGIVFSAYDFDEFVTVGEFYSNTDNLNMLNSIINESMSSFEIPSKVKYAFHDLFFDIPMRQLVKDYVHFHARFVCHVTNLKQLIEQVYEKFSLRDCIYLSVIVPKEEKKNICKTILVEYFTFVAILRIFDEYKRRKQLQ